MRPAPPRKQAGFSYIVLLIMIAIIGVMSAGMLSAGSVMQRRSAEDELLFIGKQFQIALRSYSEATPMGSQPYPAKLTDLLKDPRFPMPRRHLRKLYADPLTGSTDWGLINAPGGGIFGVYSRSDDTPIRISGFEEQFAHFEGATRYSEWVFSGERTAGKMGQ